MSSGLLAVLVTHLVGSTELMTRIGDPAFDELRAELGLGSVERQAVALIGELP